jgi:dCTP deaminase
MILSDKEIEAARADGSLIIEPFDQRNLGSDTYDVRLGEFYFQEHQPAWRPQPRLRTLFDPFSKDSVSNVWGKVCRAEDSTILIKPGETILAHTLEFIGGVRGITTKMFSRSSVGRSMLGVCKCAGRGDVGYFNRWTMEITSFSQYHTIPLRVGMRIAQIEFLRVGETRQVYGVDRGKYQQGADLSELMRTWQPEMMLPRLYNDFEERP